MTHKSRTITRMSTYNPRALEMDRRQFLTLFGSAAVGGLILAACGGETGAGTTLAPGSTASSGGGAGVPQTNLPLINTGYDNPSFYHHATDVVAWEAGFMAEAGFEEFSDIVINDSLTAIVGGGLDWTAEDTDAVIPNEINNDIGVVWLGVRGENEDLLFGLAPGVTLEQLAAEQGFVSGGEIGTRNELLGKKMVAEMGLDPENDVQWVSMGGGSDTRLASLLSGELMGSNIQRRHIVPLTEAGGTVAFEERRKVAQDGYVVQRTFLEENRDAVTAYLWALIKGRQYLLDLETKDEVIGWLEEHDFEFNENLRDAYDEQIQLYSPDLGFEIPSMELVWEELAEIGEVEPDIPWREAVDLEPLWAAQEAAGLERRPASL